MQGLGARAARARRATHRGRVRVPSARGAPMGDDRRARAALGRAALGRDAPRRLRRRQLRDGRGRAARHVVREASIPEDGHDPPAEAPDERVRHRDGVHAPVAKTLGDHIRGSVEKTALADFREHHRRRRAAGAGGADCTDRVLALRRRGAPRRRFRWGVDQSSRAPRWTTQLQRHARARMQCRPCAGLFALHDTQSRVHQARMPRTLAMFIARAAPEAVQNLTRSQAEGRAEGRGRKPYGPIEKKGSSCA